MHAYVHMQEDTQSPHTHQEALLQPQELQLVRLLQQRGVDRLRLLGHTVVGALQGVKGRIVL